MNRFAIALVVLAASIVPPFAAMGQDEEEVSIEEVQTEPETYDAEAEQVDEKAFTYEQDEEGWRVHGIAIERIVAMTNWDQYESLARFQRVLEAMGITMALREAGIQEGDTVFIGDQELQWGWPED